MPSKTSNNKNAKKFLRTPKNEFLSVCVCAARDWRGKGGFLSLQRKPKKRYFS